MELKTSSHVGEDSKDSSKVAAKILATLYIYLSKCYQKLILEKLI